MQWIAKNYDSARHAVAEERERVLVEVEISKDMVQSQWQWRAKTVCGRTVTGISGATSFAPDCKTCARHV